MNHKTSTWILFALVLAELLSSTYWMDDWGMEVCRYVHFLSGSFIFILLLATPMNQIINKQDVPRWVLLLIFTILILWSAKKLALLFAIHPIDYTYADMLPVIRIMCQRWLQQEPIYTIIPEIWGGVMPVYLPAMYLPFTLSVFFSLDMRWTTYFFIILAIAILIFRRRMNIFSLAGFLFIGLWFDYVLHKKHEPFVLSQEGIVYAYYMLFALFLYTRNIYGMALFGVCCLLSRFSAVFFILALGACYFIRERAEFKKLLGIGLIAGLLLLIIGKAWNQVAIIFSLPSQYVNSMKADPVKFQNVLNDGLGWMPILGSNQLVLVNFLQLSFLVAIALAMILWAKKKHQPFYYLAFLKLSLVFFYNFLMLPYLYLFYTSVWVSIAIFFLYCNHRFSDLETRSS